MKGIHVLFLYLREEVFASTTPVFSDNLDFISHLGLETIHELTNHKAFEIRFELTNWANDSATATYSNFSVAGEDDKYTVHFDEYLGGSAGMLSFSLCSSLSVFLSLSVYLPVCLSLLTVFLSFFSTLYNFSVR